MTKYVLLLCAALYAMGVCAVSGMMAWYYIAAICIFAIAVLPYLLIKQRAGIYLSIVFYFFFALGMANTLISAHEGYKLKYLEKTKQVITGTVIDVHDKMPYTMLTLNINTINYRKVEGKLSLTVENAERAYTYGDEISFIGSFKIPQKPAFDGDMDYRARYLSRGIHASAFVSGQVIEYLGQHKSPFDINAHGFAIRDNMKKIIYQILPSEQAALLIAIMLGDKTGVSEQQLANSRKAGTSHAMATSGLHVSILLMAFTFLISRISRHYKVSAGIGIFTLFLLYFVIGDSPSISRAILMALLTLSACFFNRYSETFTALGFSALIILLLHPYALFDVGFILSFASVFGIVAFGNRAQDKYKMRMHKIVNMAVITLSALIGTSIFTAYFFGTVTLFGALANLIILPLVGLILPLGYVTGLLGWLYLPIGRIFSYSLYVLLLGFEKTAQWGAALPLASIQVARPDPAMFIIYFGLCYILFGFLSYRGRKNA